MHHSYQRVLFSRHLFCSALAITVCAVPILLTAQQTPVPSDQDQVGRQRGDAVVTPVNQLLTPVGKQVELAGLRPQAIVLAPDGSRVIVAGKTAELVSINPDTGEVIERTKLPADNVNDAPVEPPSENILKPDTKGQVSFTGLLYSHDGKRLYMSNVNGSIKVFSIAANGSPQPSHTIALPAAQAPRRAQEIPSGIALSTDDSLLYVCGNLSNCLLEIETATGKTLRTFDVGALPYDVVLVGNLAFVSNWGGRRPTDGDLAGPAGRGTTVRVDPVRHIANEGSVSIVDLKDGRVTKEIRVGLHASDLAVSPDAKYVICANAESDNLSVIDVEKQEVVDTIWARSKPSDLLGASPNAICFSDDGKKLFVANGSQNAVGVIDLDLEDRGESRLVGLIPVGWYPGALVFDKGRNAIHVANIKGLPLAPKKQGDGSEGFNSHHYHGTVSLVPVPNVDQLAAYSAQATLNLRRAAIESALLPPRPGVEPVAIPERIGEPSQIKHVVYIIKENRTYDQVFGAIEQGRGRADLCIFGEKITPNQHKIVREFSLLDNTYCCGILSADGHNWSTTARSNDYLEKSFAGFPRSYPDGMGEDEQDAMAYSAAGFIWDRAVEKKVSIRNYGEFMMPKVRWRDPQRKGTPDYLACYRVWKKETDDVIFESEPAVESIRGFSPKEYVGWEMSVPDQYRADFVIRELQEFEKQGTYPQLVIICLPNDHTSGTSKNCPTPASCMADNDLAFGRIVDALSHSRFWQEMAIFAIEDDPQAGWDHVSGYRTTAYCVSPFAKRGATIGTLYNTTSVLRTIEQILGLPPMNQFDASATPMFDCFTNVPDLKPFEYIASQVALDEMNPSPASIVDPILRADAEVSGTLNFREIDAAPEDTLNQILWRAMKGTKVAYPVWATDPTAEDEDDEAEHKR